MFYLFFLAHLVADFVLQPFWLVRRKRRWDGLLLHGGVVLACMLLLPLCDPAASALWPVMLGVTAVHIVADWGKVQRYDGWFRRPILPFLLDQVIHFGTIAGGLMLALPAASVWSLAGSPVALPALYGAAYLVAAFATPIAVMIWLDPAFTAAALAGRARARSVLVGAGAVSLALVGGVAALPVTLLGYAAVTRRPASAHPLDTPPGTLAIVCVAAVLGAVLLVIGNW